VIKTNKSKSNYIGQTINCFKVLGTVSNDAYKCTKYEIECVKCGRKLVKSMKEIKDFKGSGCTGCTAKTIGEKKRKPSKLLDLVGTKISAYTVIGVERVGNKNLLKVQCNKCGKIHIKSKDLVENLKSDGCNDCTAQRGIKKGDFFDRFYKTFKIKIEGEKRRREVKFELTKEEFKDIITSNCYYCGSKPEIRKWIFNIFKKETKPTNGLDKIDPTGHYTADNVVPCCPMCNFIKSDYSQKDFLNQIEKIHKHLLKSSTTIENTENPEVSRVASSEAKWEEPQEGYDIV
jgi:hypothetical protein